MQSGFIYGSVPPGRYIRSDLWSVESFVAGGEQTTPNINAFDIFSKAFKQLSHKYTARVSELTRSSLVSLLMSSSELEMAECMERGDTSTEVCYTSIVYICYNRDASAAHVDFSYLVSEFSGAELQKVKSNCSIERQMSADWWHVQWLRDKHLICCFRWHYRHGTKPKHLKSGCHSKFRSVN